MAAAVSDLPLPDSPTTPTISPGRTLSESCRTGVTPPGKVTVRSFTSSTASSSGSPACAATWVVDVLPGTVVRAALLARVSPRRLKPMPASAMATAGPIATTGVT